MVKDGVQRCYRNYCNSVRGFKAYQRFQEIMYGERDSLLEKISPIVAGQFGCGRRENRFSVLDVGGGDCRRTVYILRRLKAALQIPLRVTVVEQSEPAAQLCFARFWKEMEEIGSSWEIENCLIEDWTCNERFDLVLSIHSIFTLGKQDIIQKVFGALDRSGKIIIVTNRADSFIAGAKELIDKSFKGGARTEVAEIRRWARSSGVCLVNEERMSYETRLSKEKWREVLRWLTLGRYDCLDIGVIKRLDSYLEKRGTSVDEDTWRICEKEVVQVYELRR